MWCLNRVMHPVLNPVTLATISEIICGCGERSTTIGRLEGGDNKRIKRSIRDERYLDARRPCTLSAILPNLTFAGWR